MKPNGMAARGAIIRRQLSASGESAAIWACRVPRTLTGGEVELPDAADAALALDAVGAGDDVQWRT